MERYIELRNPIPLTTSNSAALMLQIWRFFDSRYAKSGLCL